MVLKPVILCFAVGFGTSGLADGGLDCELLPPDYDFRPDDSAQSEGASKKSLTRSDVKTPLAEHSAAIQQCAPEGLEKSLVIKVRFEIMPSGESRVLGVLPAAVEGTEPATCLSELVAKIRFPVFEADKAVPVTFPFILKPQERSTTAG